MAASLFDIHQVPVQPRRRPPTTFKARALKPNPAESLDLLDLVVLDRIATADRPVRSAADIWGRPGIDEGRCVSCGFRPWGHGYLDEECVICEGLHEERTAANWTWAAEGLSHRGYFGTSNWGDLASAGVRPVW